MLDNRQVQKWKIVSVGGCIRYCKTDLSNNLFEAPVKWLISLYLSALCGLNAGYAVERTPNKISTISMFVNFSFSLFRPFVITCFNVIVSKFRGWFRRIKVRPRGWQVGLTPPLAIVLITLSSVNFCLSLNGIPLVLYGTSSWFNYLTHFIFLRAGR